MLLLVLMNDTILLQKIQPSEKRFYAKQRNRKQFVNKLFWDKLTKFFLHIFNTIHIYSVTNCYFSDIFRPFCYVLSKDTIFNFFVEKYSFVLWNFTKAILYIFHINRFQSWHKKQTAEPTDSTVPALFIFDSTKTIEWNKQPFGACITQASVTQNSLQIRPHYLLPFLLQKLLSSAPCRLTHWADNCHFLGRYTLISTKSKILVFRLGTTPILCCIITAQDRCGT